MDIDKRIEMVKTLESLADYLKENKGKIRAFSCTLLLDTENPEEDTKHPVYFYNGSSFWEVLGLVHETKSFLEKIE